MRHQMAGVGFDDDPHFLPLRKFERVPGGEGEVHLKSDAPTIHCRGNDHIAAIERANHSWQNIAGAQASRSFSGKQQITSMDSDAKRRAGIGMDQWCFQFDFAGFEAASHGAARFVQGGNFRIKDIFAT